MEQATTPSIFEQMEAEQPFFVYASPGQRFANLLIDSILSWVLYLVVVFIIGFAMAATGSTQDDIQAFGTNMPLLLVLSITTNMSYYILFEKLTKGKSIGKLITGTQAVTLDLAPISWKQAFIRTVSRLVPFEPFSALGSHPWHDRWSKTIVINKRRQIA